MALNFMMHCGADHVSRDELAVMENPPSTHSHKIIPHVHLVDLIEDELSQTGYEIVNQGHAVRQRDEYFGMLELRMKQVVGDWANPNPEDYSLVMGIRNSHNKKFPASIVLGNGVFVCDNLSFCGEIKIATRHTTNVFQRLNRLTQDALGKLLNLRQEQDERIEAYKSLTLSKSQEHDLICRAVQQDAFPISRVKKLFNELDNPTHDEFSHQDAWGFFNCMTEVLKGNIRQLPKRTTRLQSLLDHELGLVTSL